MGGNPNGAGTVMFKPPAGDVERLPLHASTHDPAGKYTWTVATPASKAGATKKVSPSKNCPPISCATGSAG